MHGIPAAAVLAVMAGIDLVCLGRDTDEAMYHAVRTALAEAVASGALAGSRLEDAADRVAGLRAWLADARQAQAGQSQAGQGGPAHEASGASDSDPGGVSDGIGLLAARRALRRSGPVPATLANPLVIEVEPEENLAAGRFTWGFAPWADVRRVDPAGDDWAAEDDAAGDGAAASGSPAASGGARPLTARRPTSSSRRPRAGP